MKSQFNPGTFIVTSCGFRGYILRECEGVPNMFEIRLPSGITVRSREDLKIDAFMEDDDLREAIP